MRSLDNTENQIDWGLLEVMEPEMLIHDELKVIYINEAFEEALENPESEEKKAYEAAKAGHPEYVTRLHRLPITIEFMKHYAQLKRDSFMQELIERKEPILRAENEQYEVSLFYAFKNMFLARYPECKNIYKVSRKIEEYEERHRQE